MHVMWNRLTRGCQSPAWWARQSLPRTRGRAQSTRGCRAGTCSRPGRLWGPVGEQGIEGVTPRTQGKALAAAELELEAAQAVWSEEASTAAPLKGYAPIGPA